MKQIATYLACSVTMVAVYSCKKPYMPASFNTIAGNYLVVEALIKAGNDSTIIQLSRTQNLSGKPKLLPESNATVTVEGDQNISYTLQQLATKGMYGASPLNIDNTRHYRLRIKTADGKTYLSDYTPVLITPPIDSLYYKITNAGISFFSSTHDPANKTHYYRWDYTDTYLYRTEVFTLFRFDDSKVNNVDKSVRRTPDEYINVCYISKNSSTVLLNSTEKQSQDVIVDNPITQVESTSRKLEHRYSLLLKQYALTREGYDFWSVLKRNTESLGTVFDAQPSQAATNIRCISDPGEPVIGYVSASTLSQKRIFVDRDQLPAWPLPTFECDPYVVTWRKGAGAPEELKDLTSIPIANVLPAYDRQQKDSVYSVQAASKFCSDCTNLGTNKKPAFWK